MIAQTEQMGHSAEKGALRQGSQMKSKAIHDVEHRMMHLDTVVAALEHSLTEYGTFLSATYKLAMECVHAQYAF